MMANLIFAWGCSPSKGVLADTRMIHEMFETLQDRYNRKTLSVTFPKMFEDMLETKKEDALWEFWKSNKIQECKILYESNIATRKIGVIFVHSSVKS